jgi:hypothetical protein
MPCTRFAGIRRRRSRILLFVRLYGAKRKRMGPPRPSDAPKPPTQVLEPEDSGPRLKVEGLIWNAFPANAMETGVSKSQGTFPDVNQRSISESTHERTGPGPVANIFGTRNLVIDGLYTLGVTDDLGGASIDNGAGAADDRLSVDRNTAERALPVTLQYLLLKQDQRHHHTMTSVPVWSRACK